MAKQIPQGERDLGKVVATVRQLTNEAASTATTIGTIESDIDTLQTDVSGLDTRLDAAEADIDALEAVVHREVLTANRTYYVRTDGSDSNTGLADTAGGAFLTIGKAIDVAYTIDWSIYRITVQIRTGSFAITKSVTGPFLSKQSLLLLGDTSTPANVSLTATGNGCQLADGAFIQISGVTLAPTGFCAFNIQPGGHLSVSTACVMSGSPSLAHVYCVGGFVDMFENFTVNASCGSVIRVDGGFIDGRAGPKTITITGTPAWSVAFAFAGNNGRILFSGKTFSGAATGPRYRIESSAVIFTNGAGAAYFPGNSAGIILTGGQYI